MRGKLNQPDFLYEATRVYLMLGSSGPLDRGLVHDWMMLDWQATLPGRAAMRRCAASLLSISTRCWPSRCRWCNWTAIWLARRAARSAACRWRSGCIRASGPPPPRKRCRPGGRATRSGRPASACSCALSGKPMDDGIPGFLTVDGFHRVLLPSLADAAKSVASESWVLGERTPNSIRTGRRCGALERDVIALYEADYIQAWDAMLADLNVVPLRSLSQAAQDLYILASPQSPMRDLLASIARQVTLSVPPAGMAPAAGDKTAGGGTGGERAAGRAVRRGRSRGRRRRCRRATRSTSTTRRCAIWSAAGRARRSTWC